MYIPKRWLLPLALSGLLFAGLVMLLLTIGRLDARADALDAQIEDQRAAEVELAAASAVAPELAPVAPAQPDCVVEVQTAETADATASQTTYEAPRGPRRTSSRSGSDGASEQGDFATNSGVVNDSLFTDGGFGDVGMQFSEVDVNGPISIVHVSGDGASGDITVNPEPAPAPPEDTNGNGNGNDKVK